MQPWTKRYLRGAPAVTRVETGTPAARLGGTTPVRRRSTSIMPALCWLLGGYALITALVSWMLAKGDPESGPILALAPLSLLVSIVIASAALGATVFAPRRYLVAAIGTLGLSVGIAVASAGALITASF
ncbi:MAG TPA: hypothetical protein VJT31_03460 [Rugosimonospora sp.]|nr:hypothetical protein [Rugosimonospora sp.]